MLKQTKRFMSFLLALAVVFSLLPAGLLRIEAVEVPKELSQEAYAEADLIFDQIDEAESAPAKKNATQEQKTEEAMEIVMASDSYVEGSLVQNGNFFTWWTDDGIRCVYSPRMREIEENRTPETSEDQIINEPIAQKGGYPTGNQVYLIGPYYGSDPNFTDQYKNEAKRVAAAIGDTDGYTLYSGKAATVDKVAEAVANGAVVFFDSHGTTDYENPNDEYDFVTGANYSYLWLTSTTGLTDEDYDDGALYSSDGICINGATIANHMTKNSPSGILWMAICLGMATNTMCEPLREMGVEVVYGYSQSVSFDGDYLFEDAFWDEMTAGATVAEAIATMKSKWGNWDWSDQIADYYYTTYYESGYSTISAARNDYAAFPIVVSDEDAWPGQRKDSSYGADSLQTVKSTYTLITPCDHVWTSATCTAAATCTLCGRTDGKPLPHSDSDGDELCDVCGKDMSVTPNTYIKVTETPDDWSGQYLIVYEDGSVAFNGALTTLDVASNTIPVTITDDVIVLDEDVADSYFVIEAANSGYSIQSASGVYIGRDSNANGMDSGSSALSNTLSVTNDGSVNIIGSGNAYLRFNATSGQMRFRYYKSSSYTNQQPIALYKLEEGGSSSGGSGSTGCTHSWIEATCTEPKTCSLCGETEGSALGHSWVSATCMAPMTCSVCNVTEGAIADHVDSNSDNACDVCGTSMGAVTPPITPPVSSTNTYEKVTEAPADWSGQYLIVYEDGSLAFNGSLTALDAINNGVGVTIEDNTITLSDDIADVYFIIEAVSGGYSIQSASGYYIGNTANSNKLLSSTETAYSNTLSMDTDGSVLVKASGGSFLRFNAASDQMRFRYYKSASYAGQKAIALYKLVEEVHEHEYTATVTTEPTCTETGVKTYTCACGDSYTEEIAALGHSYIDGKCSVCGEADPSVPVGPVHREELDFKKIAFNLSGYIGLQFAISNSAAANYDEVYVKVVMDIYTDGVAEEKVYELREGQTAGSYLVFIQGVAPKLMGRVMNIQTIAVKDGVEYCGAAQEYSIKQGIIDRLNADKGSTETKAINRSILMVDMLYYGAEAQKRFSQDQYDGLVTEDPNVAEFLSLRTAEPQAVTATNTAAPQTENELYGYALGLSEAVELQLTFLLTEGEHEAYTIQITCAGEVYTYDSTDFQYVYSNKNRATIICGELKAKQMRDEATIILLKNGEQISQTYVASIEGVAQPTVADATHKNNALVTAMMAYGDSAKVYFG